MYMTLYMYVCELYGKTKTNFCFKNNHNYYFKFVVTVWPCIVNSEGKAVARIAYVCNSSCSCF